MQDGDRELEQGHLRLFWLALGQAARLHARLSLRSTHCWAAGSATPSRDSVHSPGAHSGSSPTAAHTGVVTAILSKLATIAFARGITAWTRGSDSDASWLRKL